MKSKHCRSDKESPRSLASKAVAPARPKHQNNDLHVFNEAKNSEIEM